MRRVDRLRGRERGARDGSVGLLGRYTIRRKAAIGEADIEPDKSRPLTAVDWIAAIVVTIIVSPIFGICGAFIGGLVTGANSGAMIVGAGVSILIAFVVALSAKDYRSKKQRIADEQEEIRQHLLQRIRESGDYDEPESELENEEIRRFLLRQARRDKS